MRSVILLALLAMPALCAARQSTGTPTPVIGQDPPSCPKQDVRLATGKRSPGAQKLGDLPPANAYLAVDRRVDGCRRPIVVSTGIGKR